MHLAVVEAGPLPKASNDGFVSFDELKRLHGGRWLTSEVTGRRSAKRGGYLPAAPAGGPVDRWVGPRGGRGGHGSSRAESAERRKRRKPASGGLSESGKVRTAQSSGVAGWRQRKPKAIATCSQRRGRRRARQRGRSQKKQTGRPATSGEPVREGRRETQEAKAIHHANSIAQAKEEREGEAGLRQEQERQRGRTRRAR